MLICSANKDTLHRIGPENNTIIATNAWADRGPHRWNSHPMSSEQLILINGNVAHLYDWETLNRLTNEGGILLECTILPELSIRSMSACFGGTVLATAFAEFSGIHARSRLLLWTTSDFARTSETAVPVPKYQYLADQVEFLIGAFGQRLTFLHSSGWVCSTDAESLDITRHFFIPADWRSTNIELMIEVTQHGDIVFVKRDEVAVIKRGLEVAGQASGVGSSRHGSRGFLEVPGLLP